MSLFSRKMPFCIWKRTAIFGEGREKEGQEKFEISLTWSGITDFGSQQKCQQLIRLAAQGAMNWTSDEADSYSLSKRSPVALLHMVWTGSKCFFLSTLLFFNNILSFVPKALCRLRGLGIHFLFSVYSEQIPSQVSFPVGQGELKGTSQQWRLGSGLQSGVD